MPYQYNYNTRCVNFKKSQKRRNTIKKITDTTAL